jgi:periplasmic protein TonB
MKVLLTLIALLIFITSWGQETKKKTYENESPPYKETYYVLKDNQEVKHGDYRKNYRSFSMKGQYDNGKRVGVWEFTGNDGQLVQKIDFTNNSVTNLQPADLSEKYWVKEGETFKEIKLDEPPIFMGGKSWFNYYAWTLLRYPADARRNGIEGQVFISATITKEGKMIDEKVEEGPGYGTNEEALRIFLLIPDDWIPAKVNGEAVDIRVLIPIKFKLA